MSGTATAKFNELSYLLPHPSQSPDLAPSDFHAFLKLKKLFGELQFATNQELKTSVDEFFADLQEYDFCDGMRTSKHCWTECISVRGNNVETLEQF